jgi:hypothetical protein
MASTQDIKETSIYVPIAVATFVVLQALNIVMHEFTHSTSAWVLEYMPKPFGIVWGNPLTMEGWNEGVPYHQLFPSPGNAAESMIGGSPLAVHTVIVVAGLPLLQRQWLTRKRWLYHIVYWFVVVNLAELIAYIVMRPFDPGGDTGHFNRGLTLSPWILFLIGTLLIIAALYVLFKKILPIMNQVVARANRLTEWAILLMTTFVLFLWGSGIRVISLYPNPQWAFGLIGVAAFVAALFAYRPASTAQADASARGLESPLDLR